MRIMAIDFGAARVGVALSDPLGVIVGSSRTLDGHNYERLLDTLCALIAEHAVTTVVVGNPKNMNATEGPGSQACRKLAEDLTARCGVATAMWDERRTTVDAARILRESGRRAKDQKGAIDSVAAGLILQGYLDFLNSGAE